MKRELDRQVAVVTGGNRGIGAAISLGLARLGCHVAIVCRKPTEETERLRETIEREDVRCVVYAADVADFSDAETIVERAREELGRLDILVCNAGITADAVVWKMSEAQWDRVLDVNLKGYFNYNRAAAGIFKDQRHGKIVNVSSINGLRGKHAQSNYAASKAGNIALTKALARELGKFNVNVNAVAPGLVMTEMARAIPAEFRNASMKETVLGRLAEPEDVANVVVFLCTERARHVTGSVIRVDGGQYM